MAKKYDGKVLELFGKSTRQGQAWKQILPKQWCPFTNTRCFKVRKSDPDVSIGTCCVQYGAKNARDVIICPSRLLERRQVFTDCIHLLSQHSPGNELHVVSEISIPGGSVDYFLASTRKGKVKDFVAIEFQTLDTTGTVWPERQRLLRHLGFDAADTDVTSKKAFGMNWKMTAKTILVQLHHKVDTLEHINKHLVLVIQDCLLDYLRSEFKFNRLVGTRDGDTLHIHSYKMDRVESQFRIDLDSRLSTDALGVAECLGIQAETKVELETITAELEKKITSKTLLTIDTPIPPPPDVMPAE